MDDDKSSSINALALQGTVWELAKQLWNKSHKNNIL